MSYEGAKKRYAAIGIDADVAMNLSSVRRAGTEPELHDCADRDGYLSTLNAVIDRAVEEDGLSAIIVQRKETAHWLKKQLGDRVRLLERTDSLPAKGVVLLTLALAKGLEFDPVVVADADGRDYPDTPLARRRLYTAISRAMHRITLIAQGGLSPLLQR